MDRTDWGYSVETLEPIITVEEFRALCPGLSSTDEQLTAILGAVDASIRNYCGWHVAPVLECEYTGDGEGTILMLPSMGIVSVDSLSVNGDAVEDFEWSQNGMIRYANGFPDAWRSVTCAYTAGFSSALLAQVVTQIASNALTAAPGVVSERVGDVSVTYNQTATGVTGGISLLPRDYELLAPYKLSRAW